MELKSYQPFVGNLITSSMAHIHVHVHVVCFVYSHSAPVVEFCVVSGLRGHGEEVSRTPYVLI